MSRRNGLTKAGDGYSSSELSDRIGTLEPPTREALVRATAVACDLVGEDAAREIAAMLVEPDWWQA